MRTTRARVMLGCAAVMALAATLRAQAPSTPEQIAERQYSSGEQFLAAGKYSEALKDFQAVVDGYPSTSVADDAALAIARYQLEIAADGAAAQAAAEGVLKKFPASDSVPMAYVVAGQAMVLQGLTPAHVESALASFERVARLFPGAEATAPAAYAAGDVLKRLGRCGEAIERFNQATIAYPRSPWAARARLSSAGCLVEAGRPLEAMTVLERVIDGSPERADAARARDWNRILFRLYVRGSAQPAYAATDRTIAGPGGRLRDVSAIALGSAPGTGQPLVYVAGRGATVLAADGTAVRSFGSGEVRALAVDARGNMVLAQKAILQVEGDTAPMVTLTAPRDGGPQQRVLDDLSAVVVLPSGERIVADRSARIVGRFDEAGKYVSTFASARVSRMALGPAGQIALLDRDQKAVTIVDRTGAPLARVAAKGTGYALNNPEDIAFDDLGHLYVLDRSAVVIFKPDGSLLTTFTAPPAAGAGFRDAGAFALDHAARLFIYDDRAGHIQVYD